MNTSDGERPPVQPTATRIAIERESKEHSASEEPSARRAVDYVMEEGSGDGAGTARTRLDLRGGAVRTESDSTMVHRDGGDAATSRRTSRTSSWRRRAFLSTMTRRRERESRGEPGMDL